jgi:hypothetical protein
VRSRLKNTRKGTKQAWPRESQPRVPLERGLSASATHGRPISGKFEIEDGRLQLSAYTAQAGKFFEVIVDHTTGKVVKAEPITEGEDLSAAKTQSAAMAQAKVPLRTAIGTALRQNAGFRAVSVVPSLKDGRPVADITLVKEQEFKTVAVPLQERALTGHARGSPSART